MGDRSLREKLLSQHRSARSILKHEQTQRKNDAMAMAELIYDVFKEKKRKENDKILMDQFNATITSTN